MATLEVSLVPPSGSSPRHARPDTPAKHAKCPVCEKAAQAHPHDLCDLTPEVVAQVQADSDLERKPHLMDPYDPDVRRSMRRRAR